MKLPSLNIIKYFQERKKIPSIHFICFHFTSKITPYLQYNPNFQYNSDKKEWSVSFSSHIQHPPISKEKLDQALLFALQDLKLYLSLSKDGKDIVNTVVQSIHST